MSASERLGEILKLEKELVLCSCEHTCEQIKSKISQIERMK